MAAEPESICEWLEIELDKLSDDDKLKLIGEICDDLTAQQLRLVRELAEQKRLEKRDAAIETVMSEMREKLAQLDVDVDEVMRRGRRRSSSKLPPKYRSPEGREWGGRGKPPKWITEYELGGGNREELLIKDEG